MARKLSLVIFGDELDRACAALHIANAAAASGLEVMIFFTCWGVNLLKAEGRRWRGDNWISRLINLLAGGGTQRPSLTKFNFLGLGSWLMRRQMAYKNLQSLPELMADAHELGVQFYACDTPMDLFGLKAQDLIPQVEEVIGTASYVNKTLGSDTTLFI